MLPLTHAHASAPPPSCRTLRRRSRAAPSTARACCTSPPAPTVVCSRRVLLALAPALAVCLPARAEESAPAAVDDSPLGMGQPVRPALPPAAYVAQLRVNRPAALEQLRRLIADGDFAGISVALVTGPFDDCRQAAYFLPWALVRTDEAAGTALEDAYIAVRAAWMGLDAAAIDAARFQADEAAVTAALTEFERALDAFEALIPASLKVQA